MEYLKGLEHYTDTGRSAVTFGKFDGLHLGHQTLTRQVARFKEEEKVKGVVCAFDMKREDILMTKRERAEHLAVSMDYLVECPFSEEFRKMSGEDFIRKVMMIRRGLPSIADTLPSESAEAARFASVLRDSFYERAFKALEEARISVEANVNSKMVFCNLANVLYAINNF